MKKINKIKNFIITLCMLFLTTSIMSQTDTLLFDDFSSETLGFVTTTTSASDNYQIVNNCVDETWEVVSTHEETCGSCTGRYIGIYYEGSSCTQDNIFVTPEFSPVTNNITISFDYSFNYYASGGTNYFKVYLYNVTDGVKVGSDLVYSLSDVDGSYSGSVVLSTTNTVDDKYTLRFEYYGNDDWGATFDNVLVTENLSGGNTVSIGNGISNVRRYPFDGYYDYSHTMFIYTNDELGSASTLEDIQFELGGYSTPYYFNDITIKLAHTSDEQFGTNIQVDLSNLDTSDVTTVLANYALTISDNGWTTFEFDNTFDYNGTDNLLVIVENRDGSWSSGYGYSENVFDNCSCPNDYMSWYKVQDGGYPSGYGTRDQSYRPNVRFSTIPTVLPINLTSFDGHVVSDGNIKLEWGVASQLNNDYFVVEHSVDGYVWEEIDNIIGEGTTSNFMTYESIHEDPINGYNYYRLTQVDYDGQYETFKPISLFVNTFGEREFIVRKTNLIGQDVNENYSGPILIIWNNGEVTREYKVR